MDKNIAVTDVAVIGGGAAGLLAALVAGRMGARTVLLEGSRACGLKILISGGGRCNVLPSNFEIDDFFTTGSRNVLSRLFRTWKLADVHKFFEVDMGVPLVVEEATGKVFPRAQNARFVRDTLVRACEDAGVSVYTGWRVDGFECSGDNTFLIRSHSGKILMARRIILATGGLSLPKTGSDGVGYSMARQLGHSVIDTYPALVPLTTDDSEFKDLAGVSLPVRWRALRSGKVLEERSREFLFTHRGFSGPSILDASHWWVRERVAIEVSWGDLSSDDWLRHFASNPGQPVVAIVSKFLPRRLARILCNRAGITREQRSSNMQADLRDRLLSTLCTFQLPVAGNEGYKVAEVTGGGIPLSEVIPSTLESRKTPGLYLCGEIFDVIGRIGGYNFLWAWVTGKLAGESAAKRL